MKKYISNDSPVALKNLVSIVLYMIKPVGAGLLKCTIVIIITVYEYIDYLKSPFLA